MFLNAGDLVKVQLFVIDTKKYKKVITGYACGKPLKMDFSGMLCTPVFYSGCSLLMGRMGPKMILGALTISWDDFPGVWGAKRGSKGVEDRVSAIYCDEMHYCDTAYYSL